MGIESPEACRRRQSGPLFNAKRRAYRAKNAAALKISRHLEIPLSEARALLVIECQGERHVASVAESN